MSVILNWDVIFNCFVTLTIWMKFKTFNCIVKSYNLNLYFLKPKYFVSHNESTELTILIIFPPNFWFSHVPPKFRLPCGMTMKSIAYKSQYKLQGNTSVNHKISNSHYHWAGVNLVCEPVVLYGSQRTKHSNEKN